ncbi:response regulator transcription factor [Microcella alkaliphila]|jgi:DNA-binding response OmpR family regulator|uniref:Response regulator receiver domain protein n=1 Tax=Microcella alkaliphila TaxID=279828 RepID=A0A0U5BKB2_9MICO|nr:response regulator [Microcella alkaliphila]BAU31020.1 response regulator receiver domain protein [Microcella alkaliphila]
MARILIVEDEPDVLLLLENRVKGAGHDVVSATNGEEGLTLFATEKPDLVVLDWMMPRRDGIDVCEEIRASDPDHRTKVLMLTARSQQSDVDRAMEAGADDYIVKPFSSRDLIERITALLVPAG